MSSTISSKGQITVPIKVRQRLGVKPGDKLDFVVKEGETVLRPVREEVNPFDKWIGALPLPDGMDSLQWSRWIRNPDEPEL